MKSVDGEKMKKETTEKRTAILIRCTETEAARIREAAQLERRTVSAYILRAVMNRMRVQQTYEPAALDGRASRKRKDGGSKQILRSWQRRITRKSGTEGEVRRTA